MSISQLTTNRMHISLKSIQSDPTINENIKQMFFNISECVSENAFNIQLLQSELTSKSNSIELNYGLSQKISVVEFLEYFKKVQNIIQIVQANQKKQHTKLATLLQQYEAKMDRIEQSLEIKQKQWERKKKIQELENQSMRNELSQVMKKYEKIKCRIQIWQIEKQKVNKNKNANANIEGEEENKYQKIIKQMNQIKIYSQQMMGNIKQLLHKYSNSQSRYEQNMEIINNLKDQLNSKDQSNINCISLGNKNKVNNFECKYVTFSELRQVLSNLQDNLTTSLNNYVNNLFEDRKNLKKGKKLNINSIQNHDQPFSEGQDLYQQEQSTSQTKQKCMRCSSKSSNTQVHKIEQNSSKKLMEIINSIRKDNELTSTFNYKQVIMQSGKQNVNQLEQSSIEYSIKLQWIYFQQDPILNNNVKCLQNCHQVTLLNVKELNDKVINPNHNLSYSFAKNSSHSEKHNQLFASPSYSPFYTIKQNSIVINQRGFYQIRCGLLPIYPVEVKIFSKGAVIASHNFFQIPKNGVCRAIMIYIKNEDKPNQIMIEIRPIQNENMSRNGGKVCEQSKKKQMLNSQSGRRFEALSGFICIQRLS